MELQTLNQLLTDQKINQDQWQQAMNSTRRIEKINTVEGAYWLKKAAPARGLFRYHALNFFSWLLRLPLLKAVPQPGGNLAIANEVKRLQTLSKAGILVPRLIAFAEDWLLIEEAGSSIIKPMKQADTSKKTRQQLLKKCLLAIKTLHQQGQYLSQGFVRNMLLDESRGQIAFIDFEDDPLEVMSLAEAQARDLLLLVNSTARFFVNDQTFFHQVIQTFLEDHDKQVIDTLKITTRRMQWISKLPFQKLFGHDYQKLKVGILALKGI